ncbi:hypothetical protein [Paracoccus sp. MC1862]|uniref:hypothetical protein n=1 Tax=Paracoccus sp. MC1862 TaxID=2760307 RepID=UPI001603D7C6|nr:hypothetical protein [Paracoccus sp. MC1862]MBB1498428.1 hypothetical protein [Paracoccus sp. MC1862]QQO46655.1 hypothetical protein JGR78_17105 [Paracoccus sp. MC1862]
MRPRLPLRRRLSRLLRRVAQALDRRETGAEARAARLRGRFPDAPEAWIAAVAACGELSGPMQGARLSPPPRRPAPVPPSLWHSDPRSTPAGRDLRGGLSFARPPPSMPQAAPPPAKRPPPRLIWDHAAPPAPEPAAFHGPHPARPAHAALAHPPPARPAAPASLPPPERKSSWSRVEFHRDAATDRSRPPDPLQRQDPGLALVNAAAGKAGFPIPAPNREHPADPRSFVLPERKAACPTVWPFPPLTPVAAAGFPPLPPAASPAEAAFPQPQPRPAAPLPLPPAASRPAPANEPAPEAPHPWPALPASPALPAAPAPRRWAEPLPDQEKRGWSA